MQYVIQYDFVSATVCMNPYTKTANYMTGLIPVSVTTGNFTNNMQSDLAVANKDDNTVSVLLGSTDGTFQNHYNFRTGMNPYFVTSADFNKDQELDLAVANYGDNTFSVLLG